MRRLGALSDDPFRRGMEDAEWRANGNKLEDPPTGYSKAEQSEYAAGQSQFQHMRRIFGD
jgi:hypothetical protein